MAQPEEKLYTIDDILALPDGVRAELINGRIYYLAAPTRRHHRIVRRITNLLMNYIDENGGPCEVYSETSSVYLHKGDEEYVFPDIYVLCDPDKGDEKGCHGGPDLVMEVVSPSTQANDYLNKLIEYQNAGVREYWIVDADKFRILVYDFANGSMTEYSFNDTVPVGIFDQFAIDFKPFQAFL